MLTESLLEPGEPSQPSTLHLTRPSAPPPSACAALYNAPMAPSTLASAPAALGILAAQPAASGNITDSGRTAGRSIGSRSPIECAADGTAAIEDAPCYVCCEGPQNAVFLNCGHGGMCFSCAQHCCMQSREQPFRCPLCRGVVTQVVQLGDILPGSAVGENIVVSVR